MIINYMDENIEWSCLGNEGSTGDGINRGQSTSNPDTLLLLGPCKCRKTVRDKAALGLNSVLLKLCFPMEIKALTSNQSLTNIALKI